MHINKYFYKLKDSIVKEKEKEIVTKYDKELNVLI
jgi:hypothetical protein